MVKVRSVSLMRNQCLFSLLQTFHPVRNTFFYETQYTRTLDLFKSLAERDTDYAKREIEVELKYKRKSEH